MVDVSGIHHRKGHVVTDISRDRKKEALKTRKAMNDVAVDRLSLSIVVDRSRRVCRRGKAIALPANTLERLHLS